MEFQKNQRVDVSIIQRINYIQNERLLNGYLELESSGKNSYFKLEPNIF